MQEIAISSMQRDKINVAAGFRFPDVSGFTASELLGLMGEVDSIRRRAEGYLVGLLVRYGELEGRSAAATVCHQFGISAYKARRLAKTAEGLKSMPDVLNAVQHGHISADQGGLVAESHQRAPMNAQDQQELLELGGWQNHDEFKKSVTAREDQRQANDGMSRTERQKARRSTKVYDSTDGMVVLHAEMDQLAGDRVKTALAAMNAKMLCGDTAYEPVRTFEQRSTDALVALITRQQADVFVPGPAGLGYEVVRPPKTVLVVSADYDAVEGALKNTALIDGSPIELDEFRRLACDAEILPIIFSANGQPLYAGKTRRAVTRTQLLALYRRDRGCAGCGIRPQACEAHHIQTWEDGGPTNIDNLVLLCPKCHDKVHKHGHTVEPCPDTGRFTLQPPSRHGLPPPGRQPRKPLLAA